MAGKPRMMVRLAPSILHALEYIAEREAASPAELARTQITAACQTSLDRHGWRADCQEDYMRWLAARAASQADVGEPQDEDPDIDVDGEPDPSPAPRPVEPTAPYGAVGDQFPTMGGWTRPDSRSNARVDEAARLVAISRPDGRKKRS